MLADYFGLSYFEAWHGNSLLPSQATSENQPVHYILAKSLLGVSVSLTGIIHNLLLDRLDVH